MPLSRREFLESLGVGAAGARHRRLHGHRQGFAANETINVGCIGTGGRCRKLMQSLAKMPGVRIAAVCDVWDYHLEEGRKLAEPKAFATKDYQELLDRKDIDAVLIGTPDHWHVPITVDACAAGKDVYVEKPLTHDLSEGQRGRSRPRTAHSRIVQVGTQQRTMPHFQKAHEIVKAGQLGKIHKVHLTWNRNASRGRPGRTSTSIPKTVDWKRFLGTRQGSAVRRIPLPQLALVLGFRRRHLHRPDGPLDRRRPLVPRSRSSGRPPPASAITTTRQGLWETPDTVQTLLRYPDKSVQVYFEGTFVNARNGAMLEFMGSEATLYLDRGRYEIHPERRSKLKASELILGDGPRGADFYETPTANCCTWPTGSSASAREKSPPAPPKPASAPPPRRIWRISRSAQGEIAKWS